VKKLVILLQRKNFQKGIYSKKKSFYSNTNEESYEDEEEESVDGRNEILFLAIEDQSPKEESNVEEEVVVDLEEELVAALEEIQDLRQVIKKQIKENALLKSQTQNREEGLLTQIKELEKKSIQLNTNSELEKKLEEAERTIISLKVK